MAAPHKYPQELRGPGRAAGAGVGPPDRSDRTRSGHSPRSPAHLGPAGPGQAGYRPEQLTSADGEEPKRLRKENSELKRANEILKAASALFAAELGQSRTK
ncbi:hypothetical protein GCM10009527_027680 [Actinomadura nitritigenes]